MHKLICTCFGIGYIPKGGGTVAAILCCICLYFATVLGANVSYLTGTVLVVLLTLLGIWSANHVEQYWGKDSYRVVIDEFAGMWISILFVPVTLYSLALGLVLFRIFDIGKPFYIRSMEKLPGGLGVMMDDVLAGIYSCCIVNLVFRLNVLG